MRFPFGVEIVLPFLRRGCTTNHNGRNDAESQHSLQKMLHYANQVFINIPAILIEIFVENLEILQSNVCVLGIKKDQQVLIFF